MTEPRITVVAAASNRMPETISAIHRTAAALPFKAAKMLFSHIDPGQPDIQWVPVEQMRNNRDYDKVVLYGFPAHIQTGFELVVQWDGYAVNPEKWDDVFLDYDYIGSPIPPWYARRLTTQVGNGGFSLRSRRWMDACVQLKPFFHGEPEDKWCSIIQRKRMEKLGCRIAPVEVAIRFATEHNIIPEFPFWKDRESFGFHGRFNPRTSRPMRSKK